MKSVIKSVSLLLAALFIISCSGQKVKDAQGLYKEIDRTGGNNTISEAETKDGWKLIFDGQSTTGWHGYNMTVFPDCWAIEDACLTMNTTGGAESQDIITDKVYRNFALSIDYKTDTAANSGIIFQVKEDPKYKFPYETGAEMQIIDDEGWPGKLEEWQKSGANYAMYTAKTKAHKPVGEWNNIFLVVNNNKVTQILNGVTVVEYEKYTDEWTKLRNSGKWADYPDYGKYDEGNISLQNHGSKVWFRNIKIKELE
ncbi:MAG TPA: DUF1080 domain-containing protein [Bacteroidales bacterium]|nr:DUF1080 domain-containing protein [Bacteroidales bacterium]